MNGVASSRASVYFHDPRLFQSLLPRDRAAATDTSEWREWFQRGEDEIPYRFGLAESDFSATLFTGESGKWYGDLASRYFEL